MRQSALAAAEIRTELARQGVSADELSIRTGIRMSVLKSKLAGNGVIDLEELDAIAKALGVPIARLVGNE